MARTTKVLAVSLPPDLVREHKALGRRLRKNNSELFREMWAAFKTAREEEEFYRARRRVTREAGAAWSRTSPRLSSRRSRGFSGGSLASARWLSPRHCGSSRGPQLSFGPAAGWGLSRTGSLCPGSHVGWTWIPLRSEGEEICLRSRRCCRIWSFARSPLSGGRIWKGTMPDAFAWTGLASGFRKAGFVEVLRRSATRPIMRYIVRKH